MAHEEVELEAAPSFVSFLLCCDASPAASSGLAFYCAVEVFFLHFSRYNLLSDIDRYQVWAGILKRQSGTGSPSLMNQHAIEANIKGPPNLSMIRRVLVTIGNGTNLVKL